MQQAFILYGNSDHDTQAFYVDFYKQDLERKGYQVTTYNLSEITFSKDIWDDFENDYYDLGITLNLHGFNMLTVGEDSLLTLLSCPIHNIFLDPAYFFVSQLLTRFTCRMDLITHDKDTEFFLQNGFLDLPDIHFSPYPVISGYPQISYENRDYDILFCRSLANNVQVQKAIQTLPEVFAMFCSELAQRLERFPQQSFSIQALDLLREKGISDLTKDEFREFFPILHLAEQLALANREDNMFQILVESSLSAVVVDDTWSENDIFDAISQSRIVIDFQKNRYENQADHHHCHYITNLTTEEELVRLKHKIQ